MDVNCCPRNDFSFPMKNSSKEFVSTWPLTTTTTTNNNNGLTSTISSKSLNQKTKRKFLNQYFR